MWNPDGNGNLAKIGLLTPHLDDVPESETVTMLPQGVSLHTARVPFGMLKEDGTVSSHLHMDDVIAFARGPGLIDAAHRLTPLQPNVVIYAFTSSSYLIGPDGDRNLQAKLANACNGAVIVLQSRAILAAASALGLKKLAVFHPPWFSDQLNDLGKDYFEAAGLEVVCQKRAELREGLGYIEPKQVYDWAIENTPDDAEGVVLAGGGFRCIGAINAIEQALNRPVITSNQAALWLALADVGIHSPNPAYGRLFNM